MLCAKGFNDYFKLIPLSKFHIHYLISSATQEQRRRRNRFPFHLESFINVNPLVSHDLDCLSKIYSLPLAFYGTF